MAHTLFDDLLGVMANGSVVVCACKWLWTFISYCSLLIPLYTWQHPDDGVFVFVLDQWFTRKGHLWGVSHPRRNPGQPKQSEWCVLSTTVPGMDMELLHKKWQCIQNHSPQEDCSATFLKKLPCVSSDSKSKKQQARAHLNLCLKI